jgi:DNA-binding HxlR family transcriptional regulator
MRIDAIALSRRLSSSYPELTIEYTSTVSSALEPSDRPRVCPIADALQVIGDRWALLTIRELNLGVTRFNDICANTGAPRASIAARLRELEECGLVERRRYSERPPRDDYLLTASGRELAPVLRGLHAWGRKHAKA